MTNNGGFPWANKNTVAAIQQQAGYITSLARCCADNKLVPIGSQRLRSSHWNLMAPFDTDRFVVRAGYGIFYDLQNQWYGLTTYDNISTYIGASAFYPTSTGAITQRPTRWDTLWLPSTLDYSFFGAGPNGFPY